MYLGNASMHTAALACSRKVPLTPASGASLAACWAATMKPAHNASSSRSVCRMDGRQVAGMSWQALQPIATKLSITLAWKQQAGQRLGRECPTPEQRLKGLQQ